MKTLCIYHARCPDGFGAACVVRRALGADQVEFHPGVHQEPPPEVTGRDVVIVDFSYPRPVLLEMAQAARSILILDHHRSADADLVDLPENVSAHFDMEQSGVMLAWEHYFLDQEPPALIRHIQDRDLWRFELEGTREVMAALSSYLQDFSVWEGLLAADLERLRADGAAIDRWFQKELAEHIEIAARRMMLAGYDVPVLNAPHSWASDAGAILCQGEPFAAVYWDGPEQRAFSLRSEENGVDVSAVAGQFGGGGHKHAAGFRVPFGTPVDG